MKTNLPSLSFQRRKFWGIFIQSHSVAWLYIGGELTWVPELIQFSCGTDWRLARQNKSVRWANTRWSLMEIVTNVRSRLFDLCYNICVLFGRTGSLAKEGWLAVPNRRNIKKYGWKKQVRWLPPPQAFQKSERRKLRAGENWWETNGKACGLIFQDGWSHKPNHYIITRSI